jgi:hypothetical protein
MTTTDLLSEQKKQIRTSSHFALVLLVISFLILIICLHAYNEIKALVPSSAAIIDILGIGIIPRLMLYIFLTVLFLSALKYNIQFKLFGILTTVMGIISFLMILSDYTALHDIYNEYITGKFACNPEFKILYNGLIFNFIFLLAAFITVMKIRKQVKSEGIKKRHVLVETTYEITQYVGIICSIIGIAFVLYIYSVFSNNNLIISEFTKLLTFTACIIILLPYIIMIFYWIYKLSKENEGSLLDEKQKHDLTWSGLLAFLFSIIFILVFFMINHGRTGQISALVYFPFYLFATLLVFSISVLYYFKKV